LREIARRSGVSPETVRKVRNQLRHKDLAVTENVTGQRDEHDLAIDTKIRSLRLDPVLRYSERGRLLLRLLDVHLLDPEDRRWLVDSVPPHSVGMMIDVARACMSSWREFATQLESKDTG
jgi:transposase-like protein